MEHSYSLEPSGLPGNDDYGTMSAWFVFAALGFYPLAGSTTYMVGSPMFEQATVKTSDGMINILAHNAGHENVYVQKVMVNGKPFNSPFFDHIWLVNSTIEFFMGRNPSKWGSM